MSLIQLLDLYYNFISEPLFFIYILIFEAFFLWIQVNFLFKLSNGNILIVS